MKKITFLILSSILSSGLFAQSLPSYLPGSGLLCWYPFNGNANDESGNSHHGTASFTTILTTDRMGDTSSAYHFNGYNSHVITADTFFNTGLHNYTISFWSNSDSLHNSHSVDDNQEMFNTIPHHGLALGYNWGHSNKYTLWAGSNPPSSGWSIFGNAKTHTPIATNQWRHILLTKINDTGYHYYINGVLDTMYHTTTAAVNKFCKLSIGRTDSTYATCSFLGKLDDFGMWNRVLTDSEIVNVYTAINGDTTVCLRATTTLSTFVTGGTWSCASSSIATVNATTGSVYGVAVGNAIVTYTVGSLSAHYKIKVITSAACLSGISDVNTEPATITTYPNPNEGKFNLRLTSGLGNEAHIVITNLLGQKIREFNCEANREVELNLGLPEGLYFVAATINGSLLTSKIIIE